MDGLSQEQAAEIFRRTGCWPVPEKLTLREQEILAQHRQPCHGVKDYCLKPIQDCHLEGLPRIGMTVELREYYEYNDYVEYQAYLRYMAGLSPTELGTLPKWSTHNDLCDHPIYRTVFRVQKSHTDPPI